METPRIMTGGDITEAERAGLKAEFGSELFGKILSAEESASTSKVAEEVWTHALIGTAPNRLIYISDHLQNRLDERLAFVRWGQDGAESGLNAEMIRRYTGADIDLLFSAGRRLVQAANLPQIPDWLAIFCNNLDTGIPLHKDSKQTNQMGLVRSFLNLQGIRRIKLAEDIEGNGSKIFEVNSGEGYSLMPNDHFHAVRYLSANSIALYVQQMKTTLK